MKESEVHYEEDKEEFFKTDYWLSTGQKRTEGYMKRQVIGDRWRPDGHWIDWSLNGKKVNEQNFKDGKADGLWTEWSEDGKETSEKLFKDGKESQRNEHIMK